MTRYIVRQYPPLGERYPPDAFDQVIGTEITVAIGKKVFGTMFDTGKSAAEIIAAENLGGQVDE